MERILTDGQSVRDSFSEMILQPQSDIPHFRRFIQSQGFQIVEEKMVEEEGKFYPMMRVVRTCPEGDGNENLVSEAAPCTLEEAFGKFLLKEHNPVLYRYLLKRGTNPCRYFKAASGCASGGGSDGTHPGSKGGSAAD